MDTPFHAGEVAVQSRLGVAERMHEIGRRVVRDHMPEQHQRFFEQLPMMLAGSVDPAGRPWATLLVGQPGFVQAPDAWHLTFGTSPIPGDPAAAGMTVGAPLGLLGIELHTRRRNRVNGELTAVSAEGLRLRVRQTVGNCPQYIQGREFDFVRDAADTRPRAVERMDRLAGDAAALIRAADTLFVATHAPGEGADVSHRGGRAGFVKQVGDRELLVPDFAGNAMYMTLGNLQLDGRAGLLFIDFERGGLLTLTGRAEVVWDGPEVTGFDGAERAWRFQLDEGVWLRDVLPLRWRFRDWSPQSLGTGAWPEAAPGWRRYRIAHVVDESTVIRSFHLAPEDGLPLPGFKAGQHLPVRLPTPAGSLQRSYTISLAPSDGGLRLSVKRDGAASRWLHEVATVGTVIEAGRPAGGFTLDAQASQPAVLIGAGVGITPMLAMLRHVVASGSKRPVHFIQVAHDAEVRAFGAEIDALQREGGGTVRTHLVLSEPGDSGALQGPLTADLLKTLLPFDDHEFFLCGPGAFMQSLYDGLRALGVRDERLRAEAFGPAALKRDAAVAAPPAQPVAERARVRFTSQPDDTVWTPADGSLLDFAERHGVAAPSGCRAGSCGSCATRLVEGRVSYAQPPACTPAAGEVLLCQALPASDAAVLAA